MNGYFLTPDTIRNKGKDFSRALRGYAVEDVENFLIEMAEKTEILAQLLKDKGVELEYDSEFTQNEDIDVDFLKENNNVPIDEFIGKYLNQDEDANVLELKQLYQNLQEDYSSLKKDYEELLIARDQHSENAEQLMESSADTIKELQTKFDLLQRKLQSKEEYIAKLEKNLSSDNIKSVPKDQMEILEQKYAEFMEKKKASEQEYLNQMIELKAREEIIKGKEDYVKSLEKQLAEKDDYIDRLENNKFNMDEILLKKKQEQTQDDSGKKLQPVMPNIAFVNDGDFSQNGEFVGSSQTDNQPLSNNGGDFVSQFLGGPDNMDELIAERNSLKFKLNTLTEQYEKKIDELEREKREHVEMNALLEEEIEANVRKIKELEDGLALTAPEGSNNAVIDNIVAENKQKIAKLNDVIMQDNQEIESLNEIIVQNNDEISYLKKTLEEVKAEMESERQENAKRISNLEQKVSCQNDAEVVSQSVAVKASEDLQKEREEFEQEYERKLKLLEEKEQEVLNSIAQIEKNKELLSEESVSSLQSKERELAQLEKSMKRMLIVAQETAERTEYETKEMAEKLILDATEKSESLMSEATEKSDRLKREAEEKSTALMTEATQKSEKLMREAEELSKKLVSDAEVNSKSMIDNATISSEQMIADAQASSRDIVDEAKSLSTQLMEEAEANSKSLLDKATLDSEKMLAQAKENSERLITEANFNSEQMIAEANSILENAKVEKDSILGEAESNAQALMDDAKAQHDELLINAEKERKAISDEIEEKVKSFQAKLEEYKALKRESMTGLKNIHDVIAKIVFDADDDDDDDDEGILAGEEEQ